MAESPGEGAFVGFSDNRFDVHDRCPIEHLKCLYFDFQWLIEAYDTGLMQTDGIGTTGRPGGKNAFKRVFSVASGVDL